MEKLVSVIIPVYNGELFLERCVKSVMKQTYKRLEIIVLNDGSTDKTELIVKKMQCLDDRIYYYKHSNMGVAKTRNKGINIASGEFITFLDADDTLEEDYIDILVSNIKNNDIIVSGYRRILEDGYSVSFESKPSTRIWSLFKFTATSGKLFKKNFLLDNNIQYKSFKVGEDIYFNLLSYSKTSMIKILSYAGYNAFYNSNSVTKQMDSNINRNHIIPVLDEVAKLDLKKYDNLCDYFYCKTIAHHLYNQIAILNYAQLKEEVKDNVTWLRNMMRDMHRKIRIKWQSGESNIVNISVIFFCLSCKLHLEKNYFSFLKRIGFKRDK